MHWLATISLGSTQPYSRSSCLQHASQSAQIGRPTSPRNIWEINPPNARKPN